MQMASRQIENCMNHGGDRAVSDLGKKGMQTCEQLVAKNPDLAAGVARHSYTPAGIPAWFTRISNGRLRVTASNLACNTRGKRTVDTMGGATAHRAAAWRINLGMPISLDFFFLFWRLAKDAGILVLRHPFPFAFLAHNDPKQE
jgi:hypothetical protein